MDMASHRYSIWMPEDLKLEAERIAQILHLKTAQVLVMAIQAGLLLIAEKLGIK
jgi:hypothetical protein